VIFQSPRPAVKPAASPVGPSYSAFAACGGRALEAHKSPLLPGSQGSAALKDGQESPDQNLVVKQRPGRTCGAEKYKTVLRAEGFTSRPGHFGGFSSYSEGFSGGSIGSLVFRPAFLPFGAWELRQAYRVGSVPKSQ
jgi:hypothetical protein